MNYILKDREPVPCEDTLEWARWFEKAENRRVKQEEVAPGVSVSTMFLGIDHNFVPGGDHLLFETMIFGGPRHGYQERYSTWLEAEQGHADAVRLARGDA